MEKNVTKDPGIAYVDVVSSYIVTSVTFFNKTSYIVVSLKDGKVGYFVCHIKKKCCIWPFHSQMP